MHRAPRLPFRLARLGLRLGLGLPPLPSLPACNAARPLCSSSTSRATSGQPPRAVGPVRDRFATVTTVTTLNTNATATATDTAILSGGSTTTYCASRRRGQRSHGRGGAGEPRRQQELQGLCELRRGQGVVRQVLPRVWRRGKARRQRRRPPVREPAAEVRGAAVSGLPGRASTSHSSFALSLARRATVPLLTITGTSRLDYCILKIKRRW